VARIKTGQKRSDARNKVYSIVFEYLNEKNIEFESTNNINLPSNTTGKINMSQLSKDMGLSESQRKNHMYKDEEIMKEVSRHAVIQGLVPINQSKFEGIIDENARQKIAQSNKRAKQSDEQLIEVQSQNYELILENKKLQARVSQLEAVIGNYYTTGVMLEKDI
jgi:ribosomal protein S24E